MRSSEIRPPLVPLLLVASHVLTRRGGLCDPGSVPPAAAFAVRVRGKSQCKADYLAAGYAERTALGKQPKQPLPGGVLLAFETKTRFYSSGQVSHQPGSANQNFRV